MEDQRLLASVALFRKLYDNKKDSYDVLAEFLRASINIKSLWRFTVEDCSRALKSSFGFNIPSAVLKSCLRRRLKGEVELSRGVYAITDKFEKSENLQKEMSSAQEEQEKIIAQLVVFASNISKKDLSITEEQQLREDFNQYFLGGLRPGKNHIIISQFILGKSNDAAFTESLNHLEEGLILYHGIEYSPDTGDINSWRAHYTIYLDTEILFWANGYDGILFESIFKEFIGLVREINSKASGQSKISIKYFPEARREVDSIFKAAEYILEGGRISDPSGTAMQHLLNGCRSPSDVVEKKGKFYSLLSKYKIYEEEDRNYYNPPEYNCESAELMEQLAHEFPDSPPEKIASALKLFTKINYLRKGVSNKGLEQSEAILVSGKNITRQLAFHPSILQSEGAIPYSTDIEYLTERFWFKLGKGFGGGTKTPVAFDAVARARVIISAQISNKVAGEFKALIAKVDSGEISINDASYIVSDLKSRPVKPEELNAETLNSLTEFLHADSIEAGVRSIRLLEGKAEELIEKSKELEETSRAFRDFKIQTYKNNLNAWQKKTGAMKSQARQKYQILQFSICISAAVIFYAITILLSGTGDSLLTKVGFWATITIPIMPLIYLGFRPIILRNVRKSFKENLRTDAPRPKLGDL